MIQSFSDKETKKIFGGQYSRRALRKLILLNQAPSLEHLRSFPANRLESLVGNRQGQYSIRINKQWRICFRWEDGNAYEVEITDYH